MNTFSIVVFLLTSFGAVSSFVFMTLGVLIKRLRDILPKSLISFGIMCVLCVSSLWLCGETAPRVNNNYLHSGVDTETKDVAQNSMDVYENIVNRYEDTSTVLTNTSSDLKIESTDYIREERPYIFNEQPTEIISTPNQTLEEELSEMEVHFIDVGQGDCTLIICDGKAMLIDAGDNSKGTTVQLYLQKRGIDCLDYVVGTHPDADHIGGLDVVMTKFDCKQIMMPDVSNDTATYRDVIYTMAYRGYSNVLPVVGDTYSLGDAMFTIIAPNGSYDNTNDYSIGIRLVHGENSFVFVGDAEEEAETDILQNGLEITADVLKIAHHGSNSSSSQNFVDAVNPTYAVISCGENNSYGHPSAETLNTLRVANIEVYRTDEQGSIIATSNGHTISFNCASSDSWKAGEIESVFDTNESPIVNEEVKESEKEDENDISNINDNSTVEQESTVRYIINTNTNKFHYPNCSSVERMAEEHKSPTDKTKEELEAEEYSPCGICF